MAIGSKELRPDELDTFEDERLVDELKKAKEELFNLRFQSATGQLESHGRLRAVKRDIARIYTIIRERELGIRPAPIPTVVPVKAKETKSKAKKSEPAAETEPAAAGAETEPAAGTEPAAAGTEPAAAGTETEEAK
jgi:large subunit ribosomal protein L29